MLLLHLTQYSLRLIKCQYYSRHAGLYDLVVESIAIVNQGLPEEVKASAYLEALKPLMPPPPDPPNPFSTADQLEELARKAELRPQRVFDVDWA